jgi:hypothetical protein
MCTEVPDMEIEDNQMCTDHPNLDDPNLEVPDMACALIIPKWVMDVRSA